MRAAGGVFIAPGIVQNLNIAMTIGNKASKLKKKGCISNIDALMHCKSAIKTLVSHLQVAKCDA